MLSSHALTILQMTWRFTDATGNLCTKF